MNAIAHPVAVAEIGHNGAPEPTPFDAFAAHIGDLFSEASNFLDGEGVASEGQATAVTALMDQLRKATKDAEAARKEDKRPHDEAAKAVQAKWSPLLDRAELAVKTCKDALAPWLLRLETERRAAAEAARREADEQAAKAADALKAAQATDLAAREAAEAQVKAAAKAGKAADKLENGRAQTAGGARATSLRSYWSAEVTDLKEACRHYWTTNPAAFRPLIEQLANTDVQAGKRQIPGVDAKEDRRPV